MEGAFVQLDSVEKTFPNAKSPALAGISAAIRPGIVTGLVGPDGAGKTTLMRLMAGLLAPSSGVVRVSGMDPAQNTRRLRELIGYMPQKFGLYEDLSVA